MDPLFSHRPRSDEGAQGQGAPQPRVYRFSVPAPRDVAYSAFTGDLHLWWPSNYTGFGEGTHAFIEDGVIGEESEGGDTQVWGEVLAEEPPSSLELSWTLAWSPTAPMRLLVEFDEADDGAATVVTFTHDGWAAGPEGWEQYEKYNEWPVILGRYVAYFGVSPDAVVTVR